MGFDGPPPSSEVEMFDGVTLDLDLLGRPVEGDWCPMNGPVHKWLAELSEEAAMPTLVPSVSEPAIVPTPAPVLVKVSPAPKPVAAYSCRECNLNDVMVEGSYCRICQPSSTPGPTQAKIELPQTKHEAWKARKAAKQAAKRGVTVATITPAIPKFEPMEPPKSVVEPIVEQEITTRCRNCRKAEPAPGHQHCQKCFIKWLLDSNVEVWKSLKLSSEYFDVARERGIALTPDLMHTMQYADWQFSHGEITLDELFNFKSKLTNERVESSSQAELKADLKRLIEKTKTRDEAANLIKSVYVGAEVKGGYECPLIVVLPKGKSRISFTIYHK